MHPGVHDHLLELNRRFYETFGEAFAATRRRIQPGVRRILADIPAAGNWLDLGCGSGALALEWQQQGRQGCYWGVDFSAALLHEAQTALPVGNRPELTVGFQSLNLGEPGWATALPSQTWSGLLAFAVLHHIPGAAERLALLREIRSLLGAGGLFIHSEWQFQNSPRLLARVQPWELAGLTAADVEAGDTLLDWRSARPDQPERVGLRYVHLFTLDELSRLAAETGFAVCETFESDGQGGRLAIYQIWQAM
ncbi:MAG TPA: class I SAM-dependent methyltransferase [Anaerolineaceae bacterium]|nr:class I SAM-dependent methyltransferase [Anaerolineaceae bacterium]